MQVQQLPGMAIVSLSEADRLGAISEVLFAVDPLRIAAVRATGTSGEFVVPFDRVRSVGQDAVTIETSGAAQADVGHDAADGLVGMSALMALKVVDEDGRHLGSIQSIEVGESGRVTTVDAHVGGVLGVGGNTKQITADAIRSVGSEVVTVRAA